MRDHRKSVKKISHGLPTWSPYSWRTYMCVTKLKRDRRSRFDYNHYQPHRRQMGMHRRNSIHAHIPADTVRASLSFEMNQPINRMTFSSSEKSRRNSQIRTHTSPFTEETNWMFLVLCDFLSNSFYFQIKTFFSVVALSVSQNVNYYRIAKNK